MSYLLIIPFYMVMMPIMIVVSLKYWSVVPIAASVFIVWLAAGRTWARFWLAIFGSIAFVWATMSYVLSELDVNSTNGPDIFGLAFLMGGIIGWYIDLMLISYIAGRIAWKRELQALGEQ